MFNNVGLGQKLYLLSPALKKDIMMAADNKQRKKGPTPKQTWKKTIFLPQQGLSKNYFSRESA